MNTITRTDDDRTHKLDVERIHTRLEGVEGRVGKLENNSGGHALAIRHIDQRQAEANDTMIEIRRMMGDFSGSMVKHITEDAEYKIMFSRAMVFAVIALVGGMFFLGITIMGK